MEFRRPPVVFAAPVVAGVLLAVVGAAQPMVGRGQLVACRPQPVASRGELVARAAQLVASTEQPVAANGQPVAAAKQPVAQALQWVAGAMQPVGEDERLVVAHARLVVFGVPVEIQNRALAPVKRRHEKAGASCETPAVGWVGYSRRFTPSDGLQFARLLAVGLRSLLPLPLACKPLADAHDDILHAIDLRDRLHGHVHSE